MSGTGVCVQQHAIGSLIRLAARSQMDMQLEQPILVTCSTEVSFKIFLMVNYLLISYLIDSMITLQSIIP